jgi:hypothetical protein
VTLGRRLVRMDVERVASGTTAITIAPTITTAVIEAEIAVAVETVIETTIVAETPEIAVSSSSRRMFRHPPLNLLICNNSAIVGACSYERI